MLTLLLLAVGFCPSAWAQEENGFRYQVAGNTVAITGYTGSGGDVAIPATLGGRRVTVISDHAFSGKRDLTSISIPDGVTTIGKRAFNDCIGLTGFSLPNSVTKIGERVFRGCVRLTSINLPNGVTTIGWAAFYGCTGLTSISIPNSVTTIELEAFAGCTGLTSVSLPNSVTTIGREAFGGCTGLVHFEVSESNPAYSVHDGVLMAKGGDRLVQYPPGRTGAYVIPNSVTTIGDYAFYSRTGLTNVSLPHSVTTIGDFAFAGCTGLTSVSLPDSVMTIGVYAFSSCIGLTNVRLPNSVTTIPLAAFFGCTGLTSISIPNGVTTIGGSAFSHCTGLTSLTIPNSVRDIQGASFAHCTRLIGLYFEGDAPFSREDTFDGSFLVTFFHRPAADGWGSSYSGRPAAVWLERPKYADWMQSTGLLSQFPGASTEADDPDGDGVSSGDEWFAGTDPTQRSSRLEMEQAIRFADLPESDQTPITPHSHGLHFRSVPGRYYALESAPALGDPWELRDTRLASTTQTRFLVDTPRDNAFFRVVVLP